MRRFLASLESTLRDSGALPSRPLSSPAELSSLCHHHAEAVGVLWRREAPQHRYTVGFSLLREAVEAGLALAARSAPSTADSSPHRLVSLELQWMMLEKCG